MAAGQHGGRGAEWGSDPNSATPCVFEPFRCSHFGPFALLQRSIRARPSQADPLGGSRFLVLQYEAAAQRVCLAGWVAKVKRRAISGRDADHIRRLPPVRTRKVVKRGWVRGKEEIKTIQ